MIDTNIYPEGKLTMEERKAITEAFLKGLNIPVHPGLPLIEGPDLTLFRPPVQVAQRAIILQVIIYLANGWIDNEWAVSYLKEFQLWDMTSPSELIFLQNENRTDRDNNPMGWRIENLNVLIWALGIAAHPCFPTSTCNYDFLDKLPELGEDPTEWINAANYRNLEEIVNELDLTYRMHWALVEARETGIAPPAGMRISIIYERHFALNWLTMYDENWDDITTDT